jgi:hypothetical protein
VPLKTHIILQYYHNIGNIVLHPMNFFNIYISFLSTYRQHKIDFLHYSIIFVNVSMRCISNTATFLMELFRSLESFFLMDN